MSSSIINDNLSISRIFQVFKINTLFEIHQNNKNRLRLNRYFTFQYRISSTF